MRILRTREEWLAVNSQWLAIILALEEERVGRHPFRVTIYEESNPEHPIMEFVRPAPGSDFEETSWSGEEIPHASLPLIIYLTDAEGNSAMLSIGPEEQF
jgi:hypothetical protein